MMVVPVFMPVYMYVFMPIFRFVFMNGHHGSCRGNSGTLRSFEHQRVIVERETTEYCDDCELVGSGIDERSQSHVAGGTGTTVEPRDAAHGFSDRTMRATAQAAPYPLSMPTTVTPLAQVACMANRAVTPSRPDP